MEKIGECLRAIIEEKLIGEGATELARTLGLPSRSSIGKIVKGVAGERALSHFCELLKEKLFIDEDTLRRMWNMIGNAAELRKLVRLYGTAEAKQDAFAVLRSLVAHDYTLFENTIPEFNLKDLQSLESSIPEAYFLMLAFYYLKHGGVNYYIKGKSHRERCAGIMESLGERFIVIFQQNGLAAMSVYIYSKSETFKGETHTLWSLVRSIAKMLKLFAKPVNYVETTFDQRLLPGMDRRTYFKGKDPDIVMLLLARDGKNPGCGWYDIYRIDRRNRKMENIYQMYFRSECIMMLLKKPSLNLQMGMYEWDRNALRFTWEHEGDDPTGIGNSWEKLELSKSQSLRELDRSISDDALRYEFLRSEGLEEVAGYRIADISISRQKLEIKLENGRLYWVSLEDWPFLKTLKPSEPVEIFREISSGRIFVIWTEILQAIPLDLFNG